MLEKMIKIDDLRTVWKHEAKDFSKWLSEEENLQELSKAVGIDIILTEIESSVGSFNVDLFANEENSNRKIIIENQLEDTNHDHLGKIITYASGKSADVIIWIVKRARDEHKQAVEWLNQHTDENIGFFLIEVELWKIGNSLPAPRFNVVERPNDWAKALKTVAGLSETKKLQFDYWNAFIEYAFNKSEFVKEFTKRKAQPQHWYNLAVGSSEYQLGLIVDSRKGKIAIDLYINDNKDIFNKLKEKQKDIEEFLETKLDWREAKKACRIVAETNGDIKKGIEHWNEMFDWYCLTAIKFKEMVKKFDN